MIVASEACDPEITKKRSLNVIGAVSEALNVYPAS